MSVTYLCAHLAEILNAAGWHTHFFHGGPLLVATKHGLTCVPQVWKGAIWMVGCWH